MATFLMFGKYTTESVKEINTERTKTAIDIISQNGKLEKIYALLGGSDLLFIADFPSNQDAMKASIKLTKATGISFNTSPAVGVEEFDYLAS